MIHGKLLLLATMLLSAPAAFAAENIASGQWQQLTSNAGPCKKCVLGIIRHGTIVVVTASSGWTAILETDRNGNANIAAGAGLWKINRRADQGEIPLDIQLALVDDRLYMIVAVKTASGLAPPIKTIFVPRARPLSRIVDRSL
jgi:hypothetical protein